MSGTTLSIEQAESLARNVLMRNATGESDSPTGPLAAASAIAGLF